MPFLFCCERKNSDGITSRLETIEQFLNDSPDFALHQLAAFPTDSISIQADSMLYALLLAEVRVRTGIRSTSTDTLRRLVRYYQASPDGNESRLMFANYALALSYLDNDCYDLAILPLLEAERFAHSLNDQFFLGLIYRQIANVHLGTFNSRENLFYERKAVEAFDKSGNIEYANYERCNLAGALHEDGKPQEAIDTLVKVINVAELHKDTETLVDAYGVMAFANMALQNYTEVINNYNKIFALGYSLDDHQCQLLGLAYERTGQLGLADSIINKFDPNSKSIFASLHRTYARRGNYEAAYKGLQKMVRYSDSIFKYHLHESVNITVNDYMYRQQEKLKADTANKHRRLILLCGGLVGLLVIAIYAIILRNKRIVRQNQETISSLEDASREMKSQLDSRGDERRRYSASVLQILSNQYNVLDGLCRAYSENPDGTSPAKYAKLLKSTIRTLGDDNGFTDKILADFDIISNNLISDLRASGYNLKQTDFKLLAFLLTGFSSGSISVFLSQPKSVVYDRKYKLKRKIAGLDFSRKEELLKYID